MSRAKLQRPELFRLLADSKPNDVILVEQVDRHQDAGRARAQVEAFAKEHGLTIAGWFTENELGAPRPSQPPHPLRSLSRPSVSPLMRSSMALMAGSCVKPYEPPVSALHTASPMSRQW